MPSSPAGSVLFLDSNVLIRAELEDQERHEEAASLRNLALTGSIPACVSPQILSEVFSVLTYEGRGGPAQPVSPSDAAALIRKYYESEDITLIYPGSQTMGLMLSFLEAHPVSGARIHDLRIAATMLENRITSIVTYDEHVFAHLPGITVVDPSELIPVDDGEGVENGAP